MKAFDPHTAPHVQRILEVSLYADELEEAEVFYTTVLGLQLYGKETGRHLFFKCGDQMLLIFNPAKTIQESDAAPHGSHGPGHVAFSVSASDMEAWRSRLVDAGVAIEKETVWPNGGRSLYFRDPAGNCLELATPLVWNMVETEE